MTKQDKRATTHTMRLAQWQVKWLSQEQCLY